MHCRLMSTPSPGGAPPKPSAPWITGRALAVLLLLLLTYRITYSITKRFDSDEPQHLHVVWAWATGQLPYKDVFDNHAPLFQWLSAPLFKLIGERSDINIPMRWAMIPLYFLSLYFVFRAGRVVLPPRAAWWAAVFGCLLPPFFKTSTEYRPDDLWALQWFLFLAVLAEGRATPRRGFMLGVLMGLTFSVSMKSTIFVISIGLAMLALLLIKCFDKSQRIPLPRLLKAGGLGLSGVIIAPALIVAYFAAHHALTDMYYCVITHNIVPHFKRWAHPTYEEPWYWLLCAFVVAGGFLIYRQKVPGGTRDRRFLLFLAPCLYTVVLYGFWPDITREDDLPLYPLVPLALFILLAPFGEKVQPRIPKAIETALPWAVFAGLFANLLYLERPWNRENRKQMAEIAIILKMTQPGAYVMDAKSGAIFRPRPYYFVLETVTRARLRMPKNSKMDNIIQRLVETRTAVFDPRQLIKNSEAEHFAIANYLPLAQADVIRVAGKLISNQPAPAGEPVKFEVAVPVRYTILDDHHRVAGTLDGTPLEDARELTPGEHSFVPATAQSQLALVWAGAVETGYFPNIRREPALTPAGEASPAEGRRSRRGR